MVVREIPTNEGDLAGIRIRRLKTLCVRSGKQLDPPAEEHYSPLSPSGLTLSKQTLGRFSPDINEQLLAISAPTIERILRPYKVTKGKSFTHPGGFRNEIPIQGNIWDVECPGFMETYKTSQTASS